VNCEGFGDDLWKLGLLRYSTRGATVSAGTVHVEKAERGRLGLGGAGNDGRGALPTAGKREGFSF
jgi:hypothetical protein